LSWKRFKWDVRKFKPHFSISPEEGYITAGMEVSFEVTYRPSEVGKESLYKNLHCYIQGASPLCLTLSGVCVGPPAIKEVSWRKPVAGMSSARAFIPQHMYQISRPTPSHHRDFAHVIPIAGIFFLPSLFS
jgi:hypothetical protein